MKPMKDRIFFDTNILLYAYEDTEQEKRAICLKLVQEVFNGKREGVISNQILGEFSNILINKAGASVDDTEHAVGELLESENWIKFSYGSDTVKKALRACKTYSIPFWDSVIAETMKENGIYTIITENEKDFSKTPEINVINPFKQ